MIELSYKEVKQNPHFGRAFLKLKRCSSFSVKDGYWVGKLVKSIETNWEKADEEQFSLWSKYCKKQENGKFVEEKGQLVLQDETKKVEFESAMEDFWSKKFTVPVDKLRLEVLEAVKDPGLTPEEIMAIEPLVLHLEVVKGV